MARFKPSSSPSPPPQMHQLDKYPPAPSTDDDHRPDESGRGRNEGGGGQARHEHPDDEEDLLDEDLGSLIEWKKVLTWKTWWKVKYIPYYIGLVIVLVLVALMTLYHKQIVAWLKPVAEWMRELPCGYLIPIGVLFVISFPPLFGHEIVGVLAGVVWGLWFGFGIVAAGTFLGEMGNFYTFKYMCRARAEKMEKKDLSYACLAHVVREGGFWIALLARFSAIPGHFTTVVFACSGMSMWIFAASCILSLPKQLIVVYLGVVLDNTDATTKDRIISDCVLAVSFLITIFAAWYIWRRMNQARGPVVRERRRLAKLKRLAKTDPDMALNSYPAFPVSSTSVEYLVHDEPSRRDPRDTREYKAAYEIQHGRDEQVGSWYQVPSPVDHEQRTPREGDWRGEAQQQMSSEEREWEQHQADQRRQLQPQHQPQHQHHAERSSSDPYAHPQILDPYRSQPLPPPTSYEQDFHAYQPPPPPPSNSYAPPPTNPSHPYSSTNPYSHPPKQHQSQYALDEAPFSPATPTAGSRPFDVQSTGAPAYSFVEGSGASRVNLTDGEGGDDWRKR